MSVLHVSLKSEHMLRSQQYHSVKPFNNSVNHPTWICHVWIKLKLPVCFIRSAPTPHLSDKLIKTDNPTDALVHWLAKCRGEKESIVWTASSFSFVIQLFFTFCAYKCLHHYKYLPEETAWRCVPLSTCWYDIIWLSHLASLFDGWLFTSSLSVVVQNRYKQHVVQTSSFLA